jgi:hypoxanthine phosphoribosyltransferase
MEGPERVPRLPRFKERGIAEQESIEKIKQPFIKLCTEMKSEIESGHWDAIVSDEAGGRIPTLLFLEIFRLVHPGSKTLKNLFVAGHYRAAPPKEGTPTLEEYLVKGLRGAKNVLVVTQFVREGLTLHRLVSSIKEAIPDVEAVDVATVQVEGDENLGIAGRDDPEFAQRARRKTRSNHFYMGEFKSEKDEPSPEQLHDVSSLEHHHNVLSGIAKLPTYDPRPTRLDVAIEAGRPRSDFMNSKDAAEFDSLTKKQKAESHAQRTDRFNKLNTVPLSAEEKADIQATGYLTRAHIKTLAKEIVREVWGDTIPMSDKDQE